MMNQQDIEKFVDNLLTEPEYFPKLGRAVTVFKRRHHSDAGGGSRAEPCA